METRFRFLTDEEFLNLCSEKRYKSPVIDELCRRLEEYNGVDKRSHGEIILENQRKFNCQVCEAEFLIGLDDTENDIVVSFPT